ncbi:CU044_5270 family protein [Nonomuraea sp. SYSU D8015]|uniref:CU044_5270 family protein n=1 Tax=Nonomuraea sp. SYSU D8015 TaxID=2593644 RepID=UPI001660BC26|nr:CU044_5270 family protein [Nonomuraea sp. SYSU D8015]
MDEINLLASSLPDARPPSDEVVERARARLSTAMDRPVRRRARPRMRPWGWTLGAAAATIAIVTAVITLVSNLAPAPPTVLTPPPVTGKDALLRLADDVARLPDETGAYWRRPLLNTYLLRVRAGDETFNVLSVKRVDLWEPSDPRDPVQVRSRMEYVRPATPADERAWRAAGSPPVVQRVCTPGTAAKDCSKERLRTEPSQCVYTRAVNPGGVFSDLRLGALTLADLAALPADPAKLREWLRTRWKAEGKRETFEEFLPVSYALLHMPVRPAVRAAVLRLLADLPTTKVGGSITDPLGRPGLAVAFVKSEGFTTVFGSDDEVAERYTTILDPRTGAVLTADAAIAAESAEGLAKGTFMHYTAWAPEAGWTDDRPSRPRDCRLSERPIP